MSLRWDAPLTRDLARELDASLAGARLRALRLDGDRRDLVLFFREHTLVWRLHPTRGAVLLRPPAEPGPGDRNFPARVRRVVAPPDERILRMELMPQRSGQRAADLVVELLGNQWNAVVADVPDGTIRHVLVTRDGPRTLRVGAPYWPPEPSDRAGVDGDLDTAWWTREILAEPPPARARTLVRRVAWTSPINAEPLLEDGPDRGLDLWRRLAQGHPREPVLLRTDRGLQPYPVPLPGVEFDPAESLLDAFARTAGASGGDDVPGADEMSLLPPALVGRLEDALEGARRKATALAAEVDGLPDPRHLRGVGDLILARYGQLRAGTDRATLEGFDGQAVTVELDPALSPHENADAYYDRAARAERAAQRLPGLVAAARARVVELEGLDARVRAGAVDAEELRAALPAAGEAPGRDGGEAAPLPYRSYRSSGGLEIRVGRGARHNDDLTFHHSAPDDVWLHARQVAGAHVILRWGRKETPPARDLAEAAVLAALHSKARTSGSVAVAWTFRKYVRKPRRSPPGQVVPDRVATVFVEPDPGVEERLRVE